MTYKIFINTAKENLIFSKVKSYEEEGSFIKFKDEMTGRILMYPILNAQIEVEK